MSGLFCAGVGAVVVGSGWVRCPVCRRIVMDDRAGSNEIEIPDHEEARK